MQTLDIRVVFLPLMLTPADVNGRTVVAFDVLRATTTITAAFAAGVARVVLHPTLDAARHECTLERRPKLLIGEKGCLKPEDFDLGNSPGQFDPALHAGRTMHMATTNGTRALLVANTLGTPAAVLAGALVNRSAVARACREVGANVTLLCAGTEGEVSLEDVLGCGAVIEGLELAGSAGTFSDAAEVSRRLWASSSLTDLRKAKGGRNIIAAGLSADIDFAARLDVYDLVAQLDHGVLIRK